VERLVGVHFESNNNENAEGSVGIEIEIEKKGNMIFVESKNHYIYKVMEYDADGNYSMC
jgi:hypothetical protein